MVKRKIPLIALIVILFVIPITIGGILLLQKRWEYDRTHLDIGETYEYNGVTYRIEKYEDRRYFDETGLPTGITEYNLYFEKINNTLAIEYTWANKIVATVIDINLTNEDELIIDLGEIKHNCDVVYMPKAMLDNAKFKKLTINILTYFEEGCMNGNLYLEEISSNSGFMTAPRTFMNLENLVKIDSGMSSYYEYKNIGPDSFNNCLKLKYVDVMFLTPGAFHNCNIENFTTNGKNIPTNKPGEIYYSYNSETNEEICSDAYLYNKNNGLDYHYYLEDNMVFQFGNLIYINDDQNRSTIDFYPHQEISDFGVLPKHTKLNIIGNSDYYYNEDSNLLKNISYESNNYTVLIRLGKIEYDVLDVSKYDAISSYAGLNVKANTLILDKNQGLSNYIFYDCDIENINYKQNYEPTNNYLNMVVLKYNKNKQDLKMDVRIGFVTK